MDLTVHLDGAMSLRQAHDVADRIEAELQKAHPEIVDVVVHLEPEGHEARQATVDGLALLAPAGLAGAELRAAAGSCRCPCCGRPAR